MNVTLVRNTDRIDSIPEGQLFFAASVGVGGAGVYLKRDGAVWPITSDGMVTRDGRQFTSPGCPVVGYDPITFVIK